MTPQVLTDFIAYVDGDNYAGVANEATIPSVVMKTIEKVMAGMGGTMEVSTMRVEKLEASIKSDSYLSETLTGLLFKEESRTKPIILRGHTNANSGEGDIKVVMKGLWKEFTPSIFKPEEAVSNEYKADLNELQIHVDGKEIIYIDKPANIWRVNGVDLLEKKRAALGI